MENASKALIIAGAILLSIAIIGIGMYVYQSVSGTIQDAAGMTEEEVNAYNQEFETYGGTNKRGTVVRGLCDKVRSHNNAAEDPSEEIAIITGTATDPTPAPTQTGTAGTTSTEINEIKNSILSGRTYTVTFGYDEATGKVTQIGIQANS